MKKDLGKDLVRPGEKIPDSIKIIKTNKKFHGDCLIGLKCRNCGFQIALTIFETLWNVMLFGRLDSNNPQYRFGLRYIFKYFEICFRNNFVYKELQIRGQILRELFDEDEKM